MITMISCESESFAYSGNCSYLSENAIFLSVFDNVSKNLKIKASIAIDAYPTVINIRQF